MAQELESTYKYGIIKGNQVILFNESNIVYSPLADNVLEDVNVSVTDAGNLHIQAALIEYDFYLTRNKIWEDGWINEPHQKVIKEGKRHWWSKKKSRYVIGPWVRKAEKKRVSYLMSNYKIEIYD